MFSSDRAVTEGFETPDLVAADRLLSELVTANNPTSAGSPE